jgi:hypothetical protein
MAKSESRVALYVLLLDILAMFVQHLADAREKLISFRFQYPQMKRKETRLVKTAQETRFTRLFWIENCILVFSFIFRCLTLKFPMNVSQLARATD